MAVCGAGGETVNGAQTKHEGPRWKEDLEGGRGSVARRRWLWSKFGIYQQRSSCSRRSRQNSSVDGCAAVAREAGGAGAGAKLVS